MDGTAPVSGRFARYGAIAFSRAGDDDAVVATIYSEDGAAWSGRECLYLADCYAFLNLPF